MNETTELFRAIGLDETDTVIHRHAPRRTYEEAIGDISHILAMTGPFSVEIERRYVVEGTVAFPSDEISAATEPEDAGRAETRVPSAPAEPAEPVKDVAAEATVGKGPAKE